VLPLIRLNNAVRVTGDGRRLTPSLGGQEFLAAVRG
jgi:hypothetical protein